MAFEYPDIIKAQYETLAQQRAQATADLEAARISEDSYSTMEASNRIVDADMRRAQVDQIANRYVASQQQAPQGNRYGLSQDEVDIAKNMFSGDSRMKQEDREKIYAEQKSRLRHLRATGQYRDDQGRR